MLQTLAVFFLVGGYAATRSPDSPGSPSSLVVDGDGNEAFRTELCPADGDLVRDAYYERRGPTTSDGYVGEEACNIIITYLQ